MKFDDLWNTITKELSETRKFQTLSHTGEFDAKCLGGRIHITTQNSIWTIERFDMHKVWSEGLKLDENLRFKHFSYKQQNIRTLSFILALMRDFVGSNKME